MKLGDLVFYSVNEALPEYTGGAALVYMKRSDGRVTKGMFYMNGNKPTFAAYGSEITNVIAWRYRFEHRGRQNDL